MGQVGRSVGRVNEGEGPPIITVRELIDGKVGILKVKLGPPGSTSVLEMMTCGRPFAIVMNNAVAAERTWNFIFASKMVC